MNRGTLQIVIKLSTTSSKIVYVENYDNLPFFPTFFSARFAKESLHKRSNARKTYTGKHQQ
jgi:hypothetical protein